jgi:hypothetical protein
MKYRNIYIEESSDFLHTNGLKNYILIELRLKTFSNREGELGFIRFIIDYILNNRPTIKDNETMSYGLWLIKFVKAEDYFEIYELDESFERWQIGADNAIYYMEQQKETCKQNGAEFSVPLFTQKIAISDGVLEGLNVQGIRYKEQEHMSGWYLTTSQYNGDVKNMKVVSMQTLVVARKDLLQFLALPAGYTFGITENNTCWIGKAPSDASDN